MSYIDELRERFLAAEQRFGRINEAGRDYRDRLMGLMSRVEEEIRCRRDVEQQQAQEIERLSGEVDRISGENEQLRTMMMSLLTAVEAGDTDSLGGTLNEMDTKVAALIGEGQGAAMPAQTAELSGDLEVDAAAEPVGETPDFTAELADDLSDELEEEEPFSAPPFPAGDMMSQPSDEPPFSGEDADFDHGDDSGSDELVAEETVVADEAPEAEEDDMPVAVDAAPDVALDVAEPAPVDSAGDVTSDMAEFYGADDRADGDAVPAYSHAVAGWEDFLDDDGIAPEASVSPDESQSALSEVSDDFVGEDAGDPEAGSIHELIDRVKTVVDGEDDAPDAEAGADDDKPDEGDDDGDKAATR